jgi:hypothetical protein
VTDHGVESVRPSAPYYNFENSRLLETGNHGGEMYDWPVHLAEKTWVDIEAFIDAFVKALDLHAGSYREKVDAAMLSKSLAQARKAARRLAKRRHQFDDCLFSQFGLTTQIVRL